MNDAQPVLEYAVIGHPNEGKSSLVSTLSEDDSVRISPYPGETLSCRVFPVTVDGREIIRFIDTPGFQSPRRALSWLESHPGPPGERLSAFLKAHRNNPDFKDECELLAPVASGAGIIFVADGSRPLRNSDIAEMKILILTGQPVMGVLNNKTISKEYMTDWEDAFHRYFGKTVHFNAHSASFVERLTLLDHLKSMDPNHSEAIDNAIRAFKTEWDRRNTLTADIILRLAEQGLTHCVRLKIRDRSLLELEKKRLQDQWRKDIVSMEKGAHESIRSLFKHNIFNIDMPEHSLLDHDLFDSETWRVLGLSQKELIASAASIGAAAAAVVDLALAGHSLGLFAILGGLAGGASALLGANRIGRARFFGRSLSSWKIKIGPSRNIQLMFILTDRALIYYTHVINWAHGRRDPETVTDGSNTPRRKDTASDWNKELKISFLDYYSAMGSKNSEKKIRLREKASDSVRKLLDAIPFRIKATHDTEL